METFQQGKKDGVFFSFYAGWHFFGGTPINSCQSYAKDTILGAQSHVDKEVERPLGSNVGSWLVCGPPPPPPPSLNYIWTLFKVENQKFSSQKKNIPSIK